MAPTKEMPTANLVKRFVRMARATPDQGVEMSDAAPTNSDRQVTEQPQDFDGGVVDVEDSSASSSPNTVPTTQHAHDATEPRFIIGVDFGTTFSTISFLRIESGMQRGLVAAESIQCVHNFPRTQMPRGTIASVFADNTTVPSDLWYPLGKSTTRHENGNALHAENDDEEAGESSALDDEGEISSTEDLTIERAKPAAPRMHQRPDPIWGWGVYKKIAEPDGTALNSKHVKNFKLLLDESGASKDLHADALRDLRALQSKKIVQGSVDIISDYLERLFRHTKDQLTTLHGLEDSDQIEFVLCVPVQWSDKACRTMQEAMQRAIVASGLGQLTDSCVKDLFIVAEPEAAAAFVISQTQYAKYINRGETFVLLDCGGGTVDAITYKVIQTEPPRLQEVIGPKGASCGSSFLNKGFRKLLKSRLNGAKLANTETPLDQIIESEVINWENGWKRNIDITNKDEQFPGVLIHGLETDLPGRISNNRVQFIRKEIKEIFKHSLREVAKLLREQLQLAKSKIDVETGRGFNVQHVFLIGGYGESPSLRSHIANVLATERNILGERIRLIITQHIDSAVARGAVLRSLNKEDGPRRITRTSYGVRTSNLYDPDLPEHRGLRGRRSPVDGQLYIENCLHWQILAGDEIPVIKRIRIPTACDFKPNWKFFRCEAELWVSSRRHESGYRSRHEKNKGAEIAGMITVDLTFIKYDESYQPITVVDSLGKEHTYYKVDFDIWLIIEGRNLRFEARSPSDPDNVNTSKSFSIAAGFIPGTA